MGFVGNLPGFPTVQEFWKPIKNYRHEYGVLLFWDTVYTIRYDTILCI